MWTTQPGRGGDAVVLDVDRQLAALDAVDLGGRVAVQGGRAATRREADLDGEQGALRLRAGDAEGELVGADAEGVHGVLRDSTSCLSI